MNNKGFTLVEVLVTIVLIALLGGIGVMAVRSFLGTGEEKYYDAIENDILLAANDYYTDHRDELPTGNSYNEVELTELVSNKYMDPVKDSNGNACTNGKVYVYRENNQYRYEVCLDCNGYKSEGKYCNGAVVNTITITAKTKNTNKTYNATVSYNAAEYTNGESVLVTFSMTNDKVFKYEVVNTNNNTKKQCNAGSGNSCYVDIDESGTYKVTAYDKDSNVLATNQYFSVKIAKNGPKFTISGLDKNQISKTECNSGKTTKKVTYTIVKDNINEEYKTIEYKINNGSYKSINSLVINEELESGHYTLEVKITNFADAATILTKDFNVTYLIDFEYDDDHSKGTHEVVKGQTYNYLSALPTHKMAYGQNLEIRWHLNDVQINPNVAIVNNSCTHKLIGKMSIPVVVPSDWTTYCANPTYDGTKKTLTKNAPEHVTFVNNTGIVAKEYTITAKIDSPQYIWQDGNNYDFGDKTFKCSINKLKITLTATNQSKVYNKSALTANSECSITSGSLPSKHTVSCSNGGTITNVGSVAKTLNSVVIKNGSGVDVSSSFTISKKNGTLTVTPANPTCPTTSAYSGTYDTKAHSISVSGGANGTIQYSTDNSSWSTTNPTRTNAGSQTTYVRIVGSGNYNNTVACTSRTISIEKAKATLTCIDRTYNGKKQTMYSNATGCSSVTNGEKKNQGEYTLTCNPDDNHTAPKTCVAKMYREFTNIVCRCMSTTSSQHASHTHCGVSGSVKWSSGNPDTSQDDRNWACRHEICVKACQDPKNYWMSSMGIKASECEAHYAIDNTKACPYGKTCSACSGY